MYLLDSNELFEVTPVPVDFISSSTIPSSSISSNWSQNSWFIYTVIGASILLTAIFIAIIYDICYRCYEFREQQIFDGGPPASPGHQYTYTFGIQVDDASLSFDTKQTVIKIDLLDIRNQYLTSVAVPCFVFKFKQNNVKSSDSLPGYPTPFTNNNNINNNNNNNSSKNKNQLNYKSLSLYQESWGNVPKASVIIFHLTRRYPLKDFASIRITHDCFKLNAYITFKYLVIRDDLSKQSAKVELSGKQIFAVHPCPPSGTQVYGAFRVVGDQQLDERKSCIKILKRCLL